MKMNLRRILSLFLAVILTFAVMQMEGFAADGDETEIKDPVTDEYGEIVSKGDLEVHDNGQFSFIVYSTDSDGNIAEIVKYLKSEERVTVPQALDGYADYPVRVIGKEAFLSGSQLRDVYLPDTLETIGEAAFGNCASLERLIMPDSVRLIENRAFFGCESLSFLHISEALEEIGDSAFERCVNLTGNVLIDGTEYFALVLPSTVREIGSGAFSQCESLIRVIIPEGVTEIKTGTFTNCKGLERVEIPSTVTYIGVAFNSAFTAHGNKSEYEPTLVIKAPHAEIEVSPDIDDHMVIEGVKYSKVDAFVRALNDAFEASTSMKDRYIEFREIEVPGHVYSIDPDRSKEPTCTEIGYTAYVCGCKEFIDKYPDDPSDPNSATHEGYRTDYKAALGHKLGEWKQVTDPTCEGEGAKKAVCERCDYAEYTKLPADGHKWVYTDTTTCTENGMWRKICSVCGTEADRKARVAYGHDYRVLRVTMQRIPCQVDGMIDYVCSRLDQGCDHPYVTEIVPAHADVNNDRFCDDCNTYLPARDCDCECHTQIGLRAWFYKIKLFIWKLFGAYKICECGYSHY